MKCYKKLDWIFTFLLVSSSLGSLAQSSVNYTMVTSTNASLTSDKNGNTINLSTEQNLIPNINWFNNSALLDIGFGFVFMGKYYSHFIAGYNGHIGLGLASSPTNMLLPGAGNLLSRNVTYPPTTFAAPILAAFWDDLRTSSTGPTVRSKLIGSAPKRCLVIEWNVAINFNSATSTNPSDGVFQMRLYESTGEIEYVYGKMQIGLGSTTVTASMGFTSGNTNNSFIAIKDLSTFNITRLVSEEPATQNLVNSATPGAIAGLNSSADGSRRFISFQPVACNGNFITANTSRVLATTMQLNWTDNITNKFGYLVYRSVVDSNNYQYVANLPPSASSYVANNLNTNTRYYWKIIPYTEGNTSTIQVLTDSTRCSMKGVYKIGAGGNFNSIRSAQDSLALWGMADAITWELLPAFSFASENLPVQFKSLAPCHEKNYTLTIQPAAGAGFSFINNSASPVFLIDSSKNIIIEGRAGGSGPGALILEGPGELIKIRNGWNNQINFIEFKSNTASSTISPVSIEGTAGGGSYLNSINNCVLHDRGSSFSLPLQLIRSVISNGAPNYNNIISGCNFYNFKRFALDIDGKGWTINNNSFYCTVPINATDSSGFINISTNDNTLINQIAGNYFGGSGPNCGGNVLTWNSSWFFNGIGVNASSVIKNNQFKRIKITTAPTLPTPDSYIDLIRVGKLGSGGVTMDFTIQKNQFGSLGPADSISLISNTAASVSATMIRAVGPSVGVVDSNTMVYIHTSVTGSNSDLSLSLVENILGNTITIKNNVLGTAQHSYRIVHLGSGRMTGFYTWGRATMTDNLITNIVAKNKIAGIFTQLDNHIDPSLNGTITGNTISHIKSLESVPGFDNFSAVGIATYGSAVLIERNKILHIEDSSMLLGPIGPVSIFSKDCNNTISRNLIDGLLQNPVVPYSKYMRALSMEDDRSVIMNNMIRLGVDSAGHAVPGGSFIGYTNTSTTTNRVIHNSFYITGNGGSSPANISYCIFYTGPSNFVNNILVNNRPNPTGSLNSIFSNSSSSQTNYTDYNVCYHVPNGIFALSSSGNLSFSQWMNLGQDVHSVLMQPNFVSPDEPTRLLDLHVAAPTPVDHSGTSFGSYTTTYDYDGDVRANISPVDIGADAVTEVVTPVITGVSNKCQNSQTAKGKLTNPPLNATVTITQDNSPLTYSAADSSFTYFTSGVTTIGNHLITVKYTSGSVIIQRDTAYTVFPVVIPTITLSGNTTVTTGQSTNLTAVTTNGGGNASFQWQDSTNSAGWKDIAATDSVISYTPAATGHKVRVKMTSNIICANPLTVTSTALVFTITVTTAINPVASGRYGLKVYPNPVINELIIDSLKLADKWESFELVSIDGKKVIAKRIINQTRIIQPVASLNKGLYTVVLRRKNGERAYFKIVKQ